MEFAGDTLRCMAGTLKFLRCYINGPREDWGQNEIQLREMKTNTS